MNENDSIRKASDDGRAAPTYIETEYGTFVKGHFWLGVFGAVLLSIPCMAAYVLAYNFGIIAAPVTFVAFFVIFFGYRVFSKSPIDLKAWTVITVVDTASGLLAEVVALFTVLQPTLDRLYTQYFGTKANMFTLLLYMPSLIFERGYNLQYVGEDLLYMAAAIVVPCGVMLIRVLSARREAKRSNEDMLDFE